MAFRPQQTNNDCQRKAKRNANTGNRNRRIDKELPEDSNDDTAKHAGKSSLARGLFPMKSQEQRGKEPRSRHPGRERSELND